MSLLDNNLDKKYDFRFLVKTGIKQYILKQYKRVLNNSNTDNIYVHNLYRSGITKNNLSEYTLDIYFPPSKTSVHAHIVKINDNKNISQNSFKLYNKYYKITILDILNDYKINS